jgi:Laminin B (Domain IV)
MQGLNFSKYFVRKFFSERRDFIKDGLSLDPAKNEIGFVFDGRQAGRRLFWSLPTAFTGNKVLSYGGVLTISQRYSGSNGQPDQDVLLIGNGKTLYWSNYNNPIQPEETTVRYADN